MSIEDELGRTIRPLLETQPEDGVVARATQRLPPRRNTTPSGRFSTIVGVLVLVLIGAVGLTSLRPQESGPATPQTAEPSEPVVAASSYQVPTVAVPTIRSSSPMPTQSLSPTPTVLAAMSELDRSSMFWDTVISGDGPGEIESMAGGVAEADLVVVGTFTGMRFGEQVGGYGVTRATFQLDEVIKGRPETEVDGTITLQLLPVADADLLEELRPTHQHLLFLYYVPDFLELHGRPVEEQEGQRYDYILMHGAQAVIRNISGTTRVLDPRYRERFPAGFEGQPFDLVLETARQ